MSLLFFAFLCLFLIVTAVTAAEADVLSAVIALSTFAILMAIVFVILQAPDVALTQAVINSGLVTSLFLVAYSQTQKKGDEPKEKDDP